MEDLSDFFLDKCGSWVILYRDSDADAVSAWFVLRFRNGDDNVEAIAALIKKARVTATMYHGVFVSVGHLLTRTRSKR